MIGDRLIVTDDRSIDIVAILLTILYGAAACRGAGCWSGHNEFILPAPWDSIFYTEEA